MRGPNSKQSAVRYLKANQAIIFQFPKGWYCAEPVTYAVRETDGSYKHFWVSESGKFKWGPEIQSMTDTMLFVVRNSHRRLDK